MLSAATATLPSTIRDSFSRNTSDSEHSKESTNNSSQKKRVLNTKLSEISGNSTPPLSYSTTTTPKEEKTHVDVEPSTSLQENLAGSVEPTNTTQVLSQPSISPSNSVTSLKIEHFDRGFDDELTTPIAGDIASQIPHLTNDRSDSLPSNGNNDTNSSHKKFRLPKKQNSAKAPKQKKMRSESILEESSLIDSPPLCGYSPAAPRRNAEFHALFRSVPEEDYLINDYGCALQKEILVQGRIYISANHVCFNANIFGWVTNLVIAFSDILSIDKKMTAFVIPNAIQISTINAKHFFTTFLARDSVNELLITLLKQARPSLAPLTESECATSHKGSDASESSEESFPSSDDEGKSTTSQGGPRKRFALPKLTLDPMRLFGPSNPVSSSDEEVTTLYQEKVDNTIQSLPPSPKKRDFGNSSVIKEQKRHRRRSKSDAGLQSLDVDIADSKRSEKLHSLSPRNQSRHTVNNCVKKHRPTQCACLKKGEHYENVSLDTKVTGSVEKIFNLFFTSEFFKRYLLEEDKCTDIEIGEWNTENYKWTRSQSYVKPLNNSIGPKSTKCYAKDECIHRDFDNYTVNLSITTTPDVPSGNSFCVKNRTCIMWAGANESRIIITSTVEWSKSSWLKGAIERACIDGQQTFWKDFVQVVRKYIAAHPLEFRDESRAQVQEEETFDSEMVDEKAALKRTHTRPKDSVNAMAEVPDLQDNEPAMVQKNHGIWSMVTDMMSSILTPLIQNITMPTTNTIILLILLMLVINNFNNWLTLRNIGNKLDILDGRRDSNILSKSRVYREYTSLFDDRIENEGDSLWQWLQERSKMYEEVDIEKSTSNSEPISKADTTSYKSGPKIHSGDNSNSHHFGSRPISSKGLYEQIGDLYKLIQVAEGHVKKLVDVAEFESSYYKDSEENMSRYCRSADMSGPYPSCELD